MSHPDYGRVVRQRGSAYLEALILLPVFAVVCVAALPGSPPDPGPSG